MFKRWLMVAALVSLVLSISFFLHSCGGGKTINPPGQGVTMKIPMGWEVGDFHEEGFPFYYENPTGKYAYKIPRNRFPCLWILSGGPDVDLRDWPLENFARDTIGGTMVYQKRITVAGYEALEMQEEAMDQGLPVSQLHYYFKRGKNIIWIGFASYKEDYYMEEPLYRKCIKSPKLE